MTIHPLARFFVVFIFLLVTVSFSSHDMSGLASMVLFLIVTMTLEDISFGKGMRQCAPIFALLFLLGIANVFLEREVIAQIELGTGANGKGVFVLTAGMVSFATLFCKGVFAVLASYCLMVLIGMDGVCYALQCLHLPKILIATMAMTYRYIVVLLKEVQRMWQAYHLRAPRQKGIHVKAWGAFVGLLLLRSMDRAKEIYQCMELRGYRGEYRYVMNSDNGVSRMKSAMYVVLWVSVFLVLRLVPVFEMVGTMLSKV